MRHGIKWSREMANGEWRSADFELDDGDVAAILNENGHDPLIVPKLAPIAKFRIMDAELERMLLLHHLTKFPLVYASDENKAKVGTLTAAVRAACEKAVESVG